MTTTGVHEVERRRSHIRPVARGPAASLAQKLHDRAVLLRPEGVLEAKTGQTWPSPRYQKDPVGFFREVLGVEPWSRQIEIINAVRDHKRVAVASGHRIGKSAVLAGLALWFYCSFPEARVVMSSTTSRQVDLILWRQLRLLKWRSKIEIDGDLHDMARSGFKSRDFREIVGFTAREAEAVAGIAGQNLFFEVDEASGVPDEIHEAIQGNRASGARIVMCSNPTKTEGTFFDAFEAKKEFWKTIQVSSEEVADLAIPGLADREWVDENRREYGEDSAFFRVRVKGQFATREDGKVLSLHAIAQAQIRWYDAENAGRLWIGVDPAGEDGQGDESAFALRRGLKILKIEGRRGLNDDGHLAVLLGIIKEEAKPREIPVVILDSEGGLGAHLLGTLRQYADAYGTFEVYGVRSSDKPAFQPKNYGRRRDELWAGFAQWLGEGGAIPEDHRLAKELHAPEWLKDVQGRAKITPKSEMRQKLGRSPDRADAAILCIVEPAASVEDSADEKQERAERALAEDLGGGALDPYRGSIDPYAGR